MERLLDGQRKFVRLNPQTRALQQVDLGQLVGAVRTDLALGPDQAGGELMAESLWPVWVDPTLLRLLLQNLVSNAIKFAAPGVPPVAFITSSSSDGESVFLSVRDNNIGIPADNPEIPTIPYPTRSRREAIRASHSH